MPTSRAEDREYIAGRYELLDLLGQGGFGEVYRARQLGMDREVALKMLHTRQLGTTAEERFRREAQLAAGLCSPHTVRLFDFGTTDDGKLFIAMELLRGCELEKALKQQPLHLDEVRRITLEALDSLAEAHAHGVIHRDLKPANIFLADVGRSHRFVKVLDFGIAKSTTPDAQRQALTAAGQCLGTPSYMSPEQIKGDGVGPHSDLYALGLIMIEMATGETAVKGDSPVDTACMQILDTPVPIPEWLRASALGPTIERAVQKDPAKRFQSADAMAASMEGVPEHRAFVLGHLPDMSDEEQPGTGVNAFASGHTAPLPQVDKPAHDTLETLPLDVIEARAARGGKPPNLDSGEMVAPTPVPPRPSLTQRPLAPPRSGWLSVGAFALYGLLLAALGFSVWFVVSFWGAHGVRSPTPARDASPLEAVQSPPSTPPAASVPAAGWAREHAARRTLAAAGAGATSALCGLPAAPPVEEAAPPPEQVVFVVGSSPSRAEVVWNGEVLGKTPLMLEFPRTELPRTLVLRRRGFEDRRVALEPPHHDGDVDGEAPKRRIVLRAILVATPAPELTPTTPPPDTTDEVNSVAPKTPLVDDGPPSGTPPISDDASAASGDEEPDVKKPRKQRRHRRRPSIAVD